MDIITFDYDTRISPAHPPFNMGYTHPHTHQAPQIRGGLIDEIWHVNTSLSPTNHQHNTPISPHL